MRQKAFYCWFPLKNNFSDGAAGVLVLVFDFHHGVEEVDHQDLGAEGQDHDWGEALEDEEEQDHQLGDCSYGSQTLGDCLALIAGEGQEQDCAISDQKDNDEKMEHELLLSGGADGGDDGHVEEVDVHQQECAREAFMEQGCFLCSVFRTEQNQLIILC